MAKRDYYEILGVDRNADDTTIKKAYRNLAMKYHPDRNPGDNEALGKMKEVNEAFAVLSDGEKRRIYDTYGHAGLEGFSTEDIFGNVDFSSLFREFGLGDLFGFGNGLFDTLFGRTRGSRRESRRGPRRGADLRYDLSVTLEEVAFGVEKTIQIPQAEACTTCSGIGAKPDGIAGCDRCQGKGQIIREHRAGHRAVRQITVCGKCRGTGKIVKDPCNECDGKGTIEKTKDITVSIPAGADTGYHIAIEGEGEKGEDIPGDLYIVFHVKKHDTFERHEDDIYLQKEIDFATATLGSEIEVPGLNGNRKLNIPEGTQTGTVFRISGAGIPRLGSRGKGDEYVVVKVVTPTNLSRKEKDLLREFARLREK